MAKKKRKKALPPRVKRMKRDGRLQSARTWLPTYQGKSIVAGYRKHFGVDWVCAFQELEMLGVKIDAGYKKQVLQSMENDLAARRRRKAERAQRLETYEDYSDQDDYFAYIAGYTEGGFAFGVTWEEWEQLEQRNLISQEGDMNFIDDDDEEIDFTFPIDDDEENPFRIPSDDEQIPF